MKMQYRAIDGLLYNHRLASELTLCQKFFAEVNHVYRVVQKTEATLLNNENTMIIHYRWRHLTFA